MDRLKLLILKRDGQDLTVPLAKSAGYRDAVSEGLEEHGVDGPADSAGESGRPKRRLVVAGAATLLCWSGAAVFLVTRSGSDHTSSPSAVVNRSATSLASSPTREAANVPIGLPAVTATVTQSPLLLQGSTYPGATVKVRGVSTTADKQGNFELLVNLEPGRNVITIVVTAVDGTSTTRALVIEYAPPATTTSPPPPSTEAVPFTGFGSPPPPPPPPPPVTDTTRPRTAP